MISDVLKCESITCKFEWKLYDLDKHRHFLLNDRFLSSKEFYHPKYPSVKWRLRVYPKTCQLNLAGIFISLARVGDEDGKIIKARFNIYTLDDDGNKIFCCPSTTFAFKCGTEPDKYQVFKSQTPDKSKDKLIEDGRDCDLGKDSAEALNLGYF
uniref:MATH domain-containing protein n=1 Tax=Meloidogyne floridensis TaxID=298350 RepID=A0A915P661_9BILA